jgi:hypothetical protein
VERAAEDLVRKLGLVGIEEDDEDDENDEQIDVTTLGEAEEEQQEQQHAQEQGCFTQRRSSGEGDADAHAGAAQLPMVEAEFLKSQQRRNQQLEDTRESLRGSVVAAAVGHQGSPSSAGGSGGSRGSAGASSLRVQRCSARRNPHKCNYRKHERMAKHTGGQPGGGFFSVNNDGPYLSQYERDMRAYHEGKTRWTGGADRPFRAAFDKRARAEREAGDGRGVPINTGAGPWQPPVVEFHPKPQPKAKQGWVS